MEMLIITASGSPEVAARWAEGLRALATLIRATDFDQLSRTMAQVRPQVLVVDVGLPGLEGPARVAALRKDNPATKIIALGADVSDDAELALFRSGVRGYAHIDADPDLLTRMVAAVQDGELWIRRRITLRLLDELSAKARGEVAHRRVTDARLAILTAREREIAHLIGTGESNKQIARQLSITERTVKAHLSEVFRKLGVGDRLRLALSMTAQPEIDAR
jgi:two-component system NarL family response regulator